MHHFHPDGPSGAAGDRQRRQHDEICAGISDGRLHRAADLAHEHLAEFPNDHTIRTAVIEALEQSPDRQLRRRRSEF
jgi:hypothetical protein